MESKPGRSRRIEYVLSRTSVTVHEAVAIMLGRADGPIEMRTTETKISDEEMEELGATPFFIDEGWDDEQDTLDEACYYAEKKREPQAIIEATEALEKFEHEVSEVRRWLCEIEDEIAKGDAAALRLDKKTSSEHWPYITLWSLKEWADSKGYETGLFPSCRVGAEPPRQRAQEDAILEKLKSCGHDPKKMPPNTSGKPGVKNQIWRLLDKKNRYFHSFSVFEKAWERALAAGDIAYEERPTPPKNSMGEACGGG